MAATVLVAGCGGPGGEDETIEEDEDGTATGDGEDEEGDAALR